MPSWPSNIPQYVLESGYGEAIQDQTVESPMEAGPAKIRRRFTQSLRRINGSMNLTVTQRADFETFWNTTLNGGSTTFTWVHPVTQQAVTMRFRSPAPRYSSLGGTLTRVDFVLEVL